MLNHLACLSVRWTYQFCVAHYMPSNKLCRHNSCYAILDLHNFPNNDNRKVYKPNFSLQKWKQSDVLEYCWETALTQSLPLSAFVAVIVRRFVLSCFCHSKVYTHILTCTVQTVCDVIYVYTNTHTIDHTISTSLHRILSAVDLQEPNYCISRGILFSILFW